MTVVVQTPFNSHVGNGVTTVFGFTFQLLAEGDLEVSLDGVVQGSGYTISGLGVQAGGDVTFSVAPANGVDVYIRRAIPLARGTDYQSNGDLPSEEIDRDYDRLWQALQDQQFNAGLSLLVPLGDTAAPVTIPPVAERVGKFLAFDGSGNAIAADTLGEGVTVSAFMETLLVDANAADARGTLGLGDVATEDVLPISKGGTGEDTAAEAFAAIKQPATESASGVLEIGTDAEAKAGASDALIVTPLKMKAAQIQLGTAVTLTNQTAVDFTGIPSWAKRITVGFSGVSTNGSTGLLVQLGDSGGMETTGYLGSSGAIGTTSNANSTAGLLVAASMVSAAAVVHGALTITNMGGNNWVAFGGVGRSDNTVVFVGGGSKTLSDTLTQIRVTTVNGIDQLDLGAVNISYE